METSLKTCFAQIFSRCPKNLSCPKFGGGGGGCIPPRPPGPYAYVYFMTALKISFRKAVFARNICIYGFSFNGFKTRMQSIDKIKNE